MASSLVHGGVARSILEKLQNAGASTVSFRNRVAAFFGSEVVFTAMEIYKKSTTGWIIHKSDGGNVQWVKDMNDFIIKHH